MHEISVGFLYAYLDENLNTNKILQLFNQASAIKLLMLTKASTIEINVGHTKFQPTCISHPH